MRKHEGWELALDKQMDMHKWCMEVHGVGFNYQMLHKMLKGAWIGNLEHIDDDVLNIVQHMQKTLWQADTIYVTSDMQHVLMQAAEDLPDDFVMDFHDILTPHGFVLFEEPVVGKDKGGHNVTMHGMVWEVAPVAASEEHPERTQAVLVYMLTDPEDADDEFNAEITQLMRDFSIPIPPLILSHVYPYFDGYKIPVVMGEGSEIIVALMRMFMAMQLLAQQTIGTPMKMRAPRATRRRAVSWDRDNERYITLITLRRKSVKKDDHVPQPVERTHRWIVRGHWRKQPHGPGRKLWHWKYIYEHIRGPENAPLLISERRVFNFRR